jgi:cytochrome P450
MLLRKAMYPDPEVFNPGRFLKNGNLNKDVCDPKEYAFGFGRRYIS